ncbi:MAG: FAD-binding oxidoreductase, partial [Alphaproteobacteria bacterium]
GGGVWDPDCALLDVEALHHGLLRAAGRHGFKLYCSAPVEGLVRRDGLWRADTPKGVFQAPVVVNAAGAWGDHIAMLARVTPLGLMAMRRTVVTFPVPVGGISPEWPLVLDIDGEWYFKTERGRILASPADETPMPPCDVQPDELDIAITMAHIERVTGWKVSRLQATWAGLRIFAPDRAPVIGFDTDAEGFFWCVGQGGVGIQTAPAAAKLVEAAITGTPLPETMRALGITPTRYAPARLRQAA